MTQAIYIYIVSVMAPQGGGKKQTRSLLVLLWRAYLNKLQKDPLLTKVRCGLNDAFYVIVKN